MTSPALATFLPILVIVIAMIIWWRATIVILGALLITLLVIGLREISGGIDLGPARDTLIGPAPQSAVPGSPALSDLSN